MRLRRESGIRQGPDAGPLLEVSDLEVRYRDAIGVRAVTLSVNAGEVVGVIGPNGAGKTTTIRAVSGFLPGDRARVSQGDIRFRGDSLVGRKPSEIARRGIAIVPERKKVFASLSVADNLAVVDRSRGGDELFDEIYQLFPVLKTKQSQLAGTLSGGERQMLALARALLLNPELLLIDEMSFGLAPIVVEELIEKLENMVTEHRAILLVEQNLAVVESLCRRTYVLGAGRLLGSGTIEEVLSGPLADVAYLGAELEAHP